MCGICGVAFVSRSGGAETRVRAMAAALQHRGPDGEGFLANDPRAPGLALAMRRLSIIDLPADNNPSGMKRAMSPWFLTASCTTTANCASA